MEQTFVYEVETLLRALAREEQNLAVSNAESVVAAAKVAAIRVRIQELNVKINDIERRARHVGGFSGNRTTFRAEP